MSGIGKNFSTGVGGVDHNEVLGHFQEANEEMGFVAEGVPASQNLGSPVNLGDMYENVFFSQDVVFINSEDNRIIPQQRDPQWTEKVQLIHESNSCMWPGCQQAAQVFCEHCRRTYCCNAVNSGCFKEHLPSCRSV